MISPEVADAGLRQLSKLISLEEVQLPDYVDWLDARIQKRDSIIQAMLPEDDRIGRIRREIQNLFERYPDVENRPPIFGIPFGVKDIFHADGFETRAGSKLPPEVLAGKEAQTVSRLRRSGAWIYAKTVTTEFAYFAPGPTRNPFNPTHTPGGSSSGSAAAVGAGMLPLALGTQTIGSILRPAAFCGVVGFKPTYERVSREGVIPLSVSLDHVGFFTRTIPDAELVASILMDDWKRSRPLPEPRLGIPQGPYLDNTSQEGLDQFEGVCSRLASLGFEIESVPVMADFEEIRERHNKIVAAETAWVHREWFRDYEQSYHAKTSELIRSGMRIPTQELQAALQGRESTRMELAEAAEVAGIDLWISPSAPGTAPKGIDSTGDPVMNLPWTHSGLPSVNLPSGFNREGLPFGLQLVGSWYGDESLLAWAARLESKLRTN